MQPLGTEPTSTPGAADYRGAGLLFHAWGANVLALDADKIPVHTWTEWQEDRQTPADAAGLPWKNFTRKRDGVRRVIAGVGVLLGVNGWRDLEFDKATDYAPVVTALQALGLPDSYQWVVRTGSGRGWRIIFRCTEDLPPGRVGNESGVYTGLPLHGGFDHLELRWRKAQSVLPPSLHPTGNRYTWQNVAPNGAPALVTADQVVRAFLAVAVPDDLAGDKVATPRPRKTTTSTSTSTTDTTNPKYEDLDAAERLLARLAAWRCDDYFAWLHVGMALRELGDCGLVYWRKWSENSAKYTPGQCAEKWNTFTARGGGITLGSLWFWAETDDPRTPDPAPTVEPIGSITPDQAVEPMVPTMVEQATVPVKRLWHDLPAALRITEADWDLCYDCARALILVRSGYAGIVHRFCHDRACPVWARIRAQDAVYPVLSWEHVYLGQVVDDPGVMRRLRAEAAKDGGVVMGIVLCKREAVKNDQGKVVELLDPGCQLVVASVPVDGLTEAQDRTAAITRIGLDIMAAPAGTHIRVAQTKKRMSKADAAEKAAADALHTPTAIALDGEGRKRPLAEIPPGRFEDALDFFAYDGFLAEHDAHGWRIPIPTDAEWLRFTLTCDKWTSKLAQEFADALHTPRVAQGMVVLPCAVLSDPGPRAPTDKRAERLTMAGKQAARRLQRVAQEAERAERQESMAEWWPA